MKTEELQTKARMSEKGRLVIPAKMREALGASTIRSRVRRVQERARRYVKPGTLVSDELSAERREAAKHE
jgi:bifunctional DNA-binding transcriptional regulator/antitoxin component of YhaV-PrlF toxin-antitoxin module